MDWQKGENSDNVEEGSDGGDRSERDRVAQHGAQRRGA